jgi:hypothetical protein
MADVVAKCFRIAMTINKDDIKYIGWTTAIWVTVNLFLNLFGLWIAELLTDAAYHTDIFWQLKYILFQSLVFSVLLTVCYLVTNKKKLSIYFFGLFQILIFHLIFFMNLSSESGRLQFWAKISSWDYTYLEANGQDLVYIVHAFYPLEGIFDDGMFIPDSLFRFYSNWIFLTLLYYFIITWLTEKFQNRLSLKRKR